MLEPCPFCGCKYVKVVIVVEKAHVRPQVLVRCSGCGGSGPGRNLFADNLESFADVTRLWNLRAEGESDEPVSGSV